MNFANGQVRVQFGRHTNLVWKVAVATVAIAVVSIGSPAIAQSQDGLTGNALLRTICDRQGESTCLAYIRGVAEGLKVSEGSGAARLFCLPVGGDYGQARDVVVKYLNDHPEQRHYPAAYLVSFALTQAFPCYG